MSALTLLSHFRALPEIVLFPLCARASEEEKVSRRAPANRILYFIDRVWGDNGQKVKIGNSPHIITIDLPTPEDI